MNLKFSIIMNCKNAEMYIDDAVTSVLKQTYQNWELIIFENFSTDSTLQKLEKFTDRRIRVIKSDEPLALGHARIRALSYVTGDVISFLDTDDRYSPIRLTRHIERYDADQSIDLIFGAYGVINETGHLISEYYPIKKKSPMLNRLLDKYDINMQTVSFRRNLLNDIPKLVFECVYAPDYLLFMYWSIRKNFYIYDNEVLAFYRVHNNSLTHHIKDQIGSELRKSLDFIKDATPKCDPKFAKELDRRFSSAIDKTYVYDAIYYISINRRSDAIQSLNSSQKLQMVSRLLYLLLLFKFPLKTLGKLVYFKRNIVR